MIIALLFFVFPHSCVLEGSYSKIDGYLPTDSFHSDTSYFEEVAWFTYKKRNLAFSNIVQKENNNRQVETRGCWRLNMQHPESPWRNMSRWILAVLVVLPCSTIWAQQDEPQISIKNRVALALKGQDVRFEFTLIVPVNQSGTMDCFNPEGKTLPVTDPQLTVNAQTATRRTRTVMIRDCSESDSGEYRCAFKKAEVYWSLLVREKGYEEPFSISNYVGIVAVGALSFGLLLFSVAGSVYVFTGNGNNATMETKSNNGSGQSEEKKKDEGDGHKSMKEAAPDSVYQSLENRNKSIYEELDHSASAGPQSDQKKVKRKSKKAKKTTVPTTEVRESVECVYENF